MSHSFRTELELSPSDWSISHQSGILTLGSCFSEELGAKFKNGRFKVLPNPFGTVFNPISIGRLIRHSLHNSIPEGGMVEQMGVFSNLHFHSTFNDLSEQKLTSSIRRTVGEVHSFLPTMDYLILTLGTAWAYRYKETSEIVSNCHKIPSTRFEKVLLSTREIISSLEKDLLELADKYPKTRVILTVSPVRHLREGMEMNAVSKSILRLVCHHLAQNHQSIEYFPAYELLLDDLRDYRFYATDQLHPNSVAIEYIWDRFGQRYFHEDTVALNDSLESVQKALLHKPFQANSSEHIHFLEETLLKLTMLNEKVNLQEEIQEITRRIAKAKSK